MNPYEIYETAKQIRPAIAEEMARAAKTEEEQRFWRYIWKMNLYREKLKIYVRYIGPIL